LIGKNKEEEEKMGYVVTIFTFLPVKERGAGNKKNDS